jgi:hypothetical protein
MRQVRLGLATCPPRRRFLRVGKTCHSCTQARCRREAQFHANISLDVVCPTADLLLPLPKKKRDRIHAVSLTSGWRAIVEDMPEVRTAARAGNFRPEKRGSGGAGADRFVSQRLPETWPARAGVELCLRGKKRMPACGAEVGAGLLLDHVTPRRGSLGSTPPHHMELRRRENCPPLVIGELHLLVFRDSVQSGADFRCIRALRMAL